MPSWLVLHHLVTPWPSGLISWPLGFLSPSQIFISWFLRLGGGVPCGTWSLDSWDASQSASNAPYSLDCPITNKNTPTRNIKLFKRFKLESLCKMREISPEIYNVWGLSTCSISDVAKYLQKNMHLIQSTNMLHVHKLGNSEINLARKFWKATIWILPNLKSN